MIKRVLVCLLAAVFVVCHAASVDANLATQAELESVKGIGTGLSATLLEERRKSAFKDWQDLISRVKGIGENNAAKFSTDGLTVNGVSYRAAAPVARKDDRSAPPATQTVDAKASGLTRR